MLYVGLVCGVIAGNYAAHSAGLDALRVYLATMVLIIPALAGARLLYVAVEWPVYRGNPVRIWDRSEGGYIMYGGLPTAVLVSLPLLRAMHLNFAAFWDVGILTILVGMFFTRIGCFLNGCCSGRATKGWMGLTLPNRNGVWEKRIPTQILESLWAAVLFGGALLLRRSMPFDGGIFLLVCVGYAGGRLVMEFAREPRRKTGVVSVAHIMSVIIFLLSIGVLATH